MLLFYVQRSTAVLPKQEERSSSDVSERGQQWGHAGVCIRLQNQHLQGGHMRSTPTLSRGRRGDAL